MRTIKSLFTLLLVSVLLISFSFNSFAANGNVTYEKNAGDFIFSPGSDFSETDLFPDLKEVMPGDSLEQNITIKNSFFSNFLT